MTLIVIKIEIFREKAYLVIVMYAKFLHIIVLKNSRYLGKKSDKIQLVQKLFLNSYILIITYFNC